MITNLLKMIYVQINYIPRGFTLKFSHNTLSSNYNKIF